MLPPVAPVVVIHDDGGGMVAAFARRVADYRRHRVVVRVRGECASACTMVLAVERICVGPDASFAFHQAFTPRPDDRYDTSDRSEPGTAELMRHYPARVRWWIDAHGGLGPDLIWLRDEELRGMVPACRGRKATPVDVR